MEMETSKNEEEDLSFHLAQFDEAILLLKEKAKAYQEAKCAAPDVVELESSPVRYLRFYEYDYKAAAISISRYWDHRKLIFGERAMRKVMDLGGEGALQTEDISLLRTGYICPLCSDSGGSPVLCFDNQRVGLCSSFTVTAIHRMRCFFYWMQRSAFDEKGSENGLVHIRLLGAVGALRSDFSRKLTLLDEAFPVNIKAIHYCVPVSMTDDRSIRDIKDVFPLWQGNLGTFFASTTEFHGGNGMVSELEESGIPRESVPVSLGGSWSNDKFCEWFRTETGAKPADDYLELHEADRTVEAGVEEPYFCLAQEMYQLEKWTSVRESSLWKHARSPGTASSTENRGDERGTRFTGTSALEWDKIVEEAMRRVPDDAKCAYLEAREKVPYLVEIESNPRRFLGFDNYDAPAAAKRLAAYWKYRKRVFEAKAFLPLIATGTGGLSIDDVAVLKSERLAALPVDRQGCSVYCFNSGRSLPSGAIKDSLNRILFYLFSVASENPKSQTHGIAIMRILSDPSMPANSFMVSEFLNMLDVAFPVKIKGIHFIGRFLQADSVDADDLKPVLTRYIGEKYMAKTLIHLSESAAIAANKLQEHGFRRETLPVELGGTWEYKEYHDWLLRRSMGEASKFSEMIASPRVSDVSDGPGLENVARQSLSQLERAFSFVPQSEKGDYLEALRRSPGLVAGESPPLHFLRHEQYNAWAAARGLARYWRVRREIFGDRCFFPMGEKGTLDVGESVSLALTVLPKDNRGRSVVFVEPSKLVDVSLRAQLRLTFYLWTILLENFKTCREGYVVVVLVKNLDQSLSCRFGQCLEMVKQTFPTSHSHLHYAQCVSQTDNPSCPPVAVPSVVQTFGSLAAERTTVHCSDDISQILARLEKYGLRQESLPLACGGSLGDDYRIAWREKRLEIEKPKHLEFIPCSTPEQNLPRTKLKTVVPVNVDDPKTGGVEEALASLGRSEKKDFLHALQNAPVIVKVESPSKRFIDFEGEVKKGATRMVRYWSARRETFGDKATLPLTQTGEGSLGRSELNYLNGGQFSVLPDNTTGCPVLCYDPSRVVKASIDVRRRVLFYLLDLMSRKQRRQDSGVIFLFLARNVNAEQGKSLCVEDFLEAIPIRLKEVLVVPGSSESLESLTAPKSLQILRRLFGEAEFEVEFCKGGSRDQALEFLEGKGLDRQGLPKSIGGAWGFEHFVQWTELQTRLEWELPAGSGGKRTAEQMFDFSGIRPLHTLSEESKRERKRRMNVVHSRRKRERERIEIEVLQEQCSELTEQKLEMLKDKEHLESLVAKANEQILTLGTPGLFVENDRSKRARAPQQHQQTSSFPFPAQQAVPTMANQVLSSNPYAEISPFAHYRNSVVLPYAPSFSLNQEGDQNATSMQQHEQNRGADFLFGASQLQSYASSFNAPVSLDSNIRRSLEEENETLRWTIREMQRRQQQEEIERRELKGVISQLQQHSNHQNWRGPGR